MGKNLRFFILLAAVSSASRAVPLCTDYSTISGGSSSTSATLQQYMNLGAGGCQDGSTLFSGFNYHYTLPLFPLIGHTDTDPAIGAGQVTVTVTGSPTAPTFNFLGDWVVSGGFQSEVEVDFTACALNSSGACAPAPVSPLMSSSVSFAGNVEDLAPPGAFPSNISGNLSLFPLGGSVITLAPSLFPSACAAPPSVCPVVTASTAIPASQQVSIGDQFFLDSGGSRDGSPNTATLHEFSQTIFDAPEPATFGFVGLGLLGGLWMGLRKPRRAKSRPL